VGASGFVIKENGKVVDENSVSFVEKWNILNSQKSFKFLCERIVRDVSVVGNAFVEKVKNKNGEIVGLSILDPRTISIVANAQGIVLRYVQRNAGETVFFDAFDLLHFTKEQSPENEAFGISRLESVFSEVMMDVSAVDVANNWYENDATPASYLIFTDEAYSSEEANAQIEDYFKRNFSGAKNKGKTSFVPLLKDVKTVSADMSKFQYLDGRKFTTEKICGAMGVPKFFLGITDAVNNNNAIELLGVLYANGVLPLEKMIADKITRELFTDPEIDFEFVENNFRQAEIEKRALAEFELGILTLRQYKMKTGQPITKEDEKNPNIDTHIFLKTESKEKKE